MLKNLSLTINLIFFCGLLFFLVKRHQFQQHLPPPVASYFEAYDTTRSEIYNSIYTDSTDIILVGTSLTEGFPVELFPYTPLRNRGIAGNTLRHILRRIDTIMATKPKQLFVEAGTNDILHDSSYQSIIDRYCYLLQKLEGMKGGVCINAIPPLDSARNDKNLRIDSVNVFLQKNCATYGFKYIDINTPLKNGKDHLDPAYTYDGIHLNLAGYSVWIKGIVPYFKD